MDAKQALRFNLRNQAKLSSATDYSHEDNLSCGAVLQSCEYANAVRLFAFVPLASEVNITSIIEHALAHKILALPLCEEDGTLTFHVVGSLRSLIRGRHGMQEPVKGQAVVPDAQDLILVPALAYTPSGERLGRGKGYYDRFLASHPDVLSIGLCRSSQLLQSIPTEPWDYRVSKVLCAGVFY